MLVDREIKRRESWLTLLMAVLLLNSGAKGLVRWTQWHTPLPLFGVEVGAGVSIAVSMVLGGVSCLVAFSLFRLTSRAWPLGLAYIAASLLLTLASWDRWDAWVAEEVHNRRAYQGVPVREGEVEFMQRLFPEALLAGLALYGIGLAAVKKRLDG